MKNIIYSSIVLILIDIFLIYSLIYTPFALLPFEESLSPLSGPIYDFNPIIYAERFPVIINQSSLTSNKIWNVFIYNESGKSILSQILYLLSLNASQISPSAYWSVSDLAGFFSNYTIARNFSIYYLTPYYYDNVSRQPNVSEIYINISDVYAFPYRLSFPPSDSINFSLRYYVINVSSLQSYANYYFSNYQRHILYTFAYFGPFSGFILVEFYYTAILNVIKYIYVNGNLYYVGENNYFITAYPWGIYPNVIYTNVSWEIGGKPIYIPMEFYLSVNSISHGYGKYVYVCVIYPSYPPKVTPIFYNDVYYEYNVTLPLIINVYNGSSPTTKILINNNNVYNTSNRKIFYYPYFTQWSFDPQTENISVFTLDKVTVGNYTIYRYWKPGYVIIYPYIHSYIINNGNNIITTYYYLNFSLLNYFITKPPNWVFNHTSFESIYENNYANDYLQYIGYYYGLYNLLKGIVINFTTYHKYHKYLKWEMLLLSSQLAFEINTSKTASNYTMALISKEGNESQVFMQIVFISSWFLWYNISYGDFFLINKWVPWTYGFFTGFEVPSFYLRPEILPYIVLNNSNLSYILYNVESFERTSWWYFNVSNLRNNTIIFSYPIVFKPLPSVNDSITFYRYYKFNSTLVLINVKSIKFILTKYVGQPDSYEFISGPGGI